VRLSLLSVLEISIKHYTLYNKYIYPTQNLNVLCTAIIIK
jgi:hypothetical protein